MMSALAIALSVVGGLIFLLFLCVCFVVRCVKENTNDCPEAIALLDQVSKALKDKVVLITGATGGIGKETVRVISKANCNCTVILACRTKSKAEKMLEESDFGGCNYIITEAGCDLSDLDNITNGFVPELMNTLSSKGIDHIDVLWCNAGAFAEEPHQTSKNTNYEFSFATNHLGHMQLMLLLKPFLDKSPGRARAIVTSSTMYHMVPKNYMPRKEDDVLKDESWLKTYVADREDVIHTKDAYSFSKLCNLWFVREFERLYGSDKIVCVALSPGFGITGMMQDKIDKLPGCCQSGVYKLTDNIGQLAYTQVWLAVTDDSNLKGGEFYRGDKCIENMHQFSRDSVYTKKCWDLSTHLIDQAVSKV